MPPANSIISKENSSRPFPLFLSAFEYSNLQWLIKEFAKYVDIMVKQCNITTIPRICAGVCRQLKAALSNRSPEETIRIVLMLQDVDEAIQLLSRLRDVDYDQMKIMAESEKNLIMNAMAENKAIDSFIQFGKIENEIIESFKNYTSAPTLPLNIFNPVDYWPDEPTRNWSLKRTKFDKGNKLSELLEKVMTDVNMFLNVELFKPEDECQATLDRLALVIIQNFFKEVSLTEFLKVGRTIETRELFEKTNIHKRYYMLFQAMLKHLAKHNIIECRKTILNGLPTEFVVRDFNVETLSENPHEIAEYGMKRFRAYAKCFERLLYCAQYLKDVLTSNMNALEVLMPKEDVETDAVHQDNFGDPLGEIYMKKFIHAIEKYIKYLAKYSENTVRVFEVGAGMGNVTQQIAPKLAKIDQIEYWFTDARTEFVNRAKKQFTSIRNLKLRVFDATKSAEEQGIELKFDVIIAVKVIHETENIRQTLSNLYSSLNESGVLFIIENTRSNICYTLTDGLLDSWWYFRDYDIRSDALCEAQRWEKALSELNFNSVLSLPTNKDQREYIDKFLFVCSKQNLAELRDTHDDDKGMQEKLNIEHDYPSILNVLEGIWKRVLGIERHIEENEIFRELGGESLLASQMIKEVIEIFGVNIKVVNVYANPTLKALALFVKSLLDDEAEEDDEEESGEEEEADSYGNYESEQKSENSLLNEENVTPQDDPDEQVTSMLIFCGQGSQKADMLQTLVDDPCVKDTLEKVKRVIGVDLIEESKHADSLQKTSFIQTALYVGSIAKVKQIEARDPGAIKNVQAVAGLSVGEFAALTYAGVLKFEDALKIVHLRGLAMQRVVDETSTAMSSILGPTAEQLKDFLSENYPNLIISGYLADNQHTVAGENQSVDTFLAHLTNESVAKNLNLIDARKLRVAGAFHTHFMQKAASEIESLIDSIEFKKPNIPLVLNVNGKCVNDPKVIKIL
ncbi:hypothetical protein B4U79_16310, partial [Dinothrombium tinctorium]